MLTSFVLVEDVAVGAANVHISAVSSNDFAHLTEAKFVLLSVEMVDCKDTVVCFTASAPTSKCSDSFKAQQRRQRYTVLGSFRSFVKSLRRSTAPAR